MEVLKWLEKWYLSNCDGDWEHGYGIRIETLDNPGWAVRINLEDTLLEDKPFENVDYERTDKDWVHCKLKDGWYEGFGGACNLEEILNIFKLWATQNGS